MGIVNIKGFAIKVGKDKYQIVRLGRGTRDTKFFVLSRSGGKRYQYAGVHVNLKTLEANRFYIYANSLKDLKIELRKYLKPSAKSTPSKNIISMSQIKLKYPYLYEAVDEMGMDNNMDINDKAKITERLIILSNANKLLRYLRGHTIKEVVIQYKISKNIPSMEYGEDNALMEYTMGEDQFIQGVNKAPHGKETQKLMNNFFDGKHTHIYN